MKLLIALAASVLFSVFMRKPLAKYPSVFYGLALLVDVAFLSRLAFSAAPHASRVVSGFFYQGVFAFGLLAIVMYTGVLARDSRLRRELTPIRGPLSIFASILMAGHVANYAGSYVTQRLAALGLMPVNEATGLVVALVLAVLLAVLAVTSVGPIRRGVPSLWWKRVQMLAYPFFFLIYLHLVFLLAPSAFTRGGETLFDLGVYTLIVGAYAVLRVRRMLCDNSELTQPKTEALRSVSDGERVCSA